jgi:hypothetical protein
MRLDYLKKACLLKYFTINQVLGLTGCRKRNGLLKELLMVGEKTKSLP